MVQKLFEKKYYFMFLIVMWAYIVIMNNPFEVSKGTFATTEYGNNKTGFTGAITAGVKVKQKFKAQVDGVSAISIYTGTYARTNDSTIQIVVRNITDNIELCNTVVRCSEFRNNKDYEITFDKQRHSKGKEYELEITGVDGDVNNCITVWTSSKISDEVVETTIDGGSINAMVAYDIGYTSYSIQNLKIALWIFIIAMSFVFVWVVNGIDEKNFLKIALILGIWVVFLNPFVHEIDESTHFFRSYAISQGSFVDTIAEDGNIGANISDNYAYIAMNQLSIQSYFANPEKWNIKFSDNKQFLINPYMSSVTPINHSVAAIGIFIGNLIGLNAVGVIILGRMCDYIFYVGICYLAIRNMKYYKTLIFTVATLPMPIWLAGSYSIDPILIATSLLFASICFKYYFDKISENFVSKVDMGLLLFAGLCIASVKYLVYTPILLLFFLIPRKKFGTKRYIAMLVVAAFIVVSMALMQIYLLKTIPFTENRNGDVDVARQVKYMFGHLGATVKNFAQYFIESLLPHFENFHYQIAMESIASCMGLFAVGGAVLAKDKYRFTDKTSKRLIVILCLAIAAIVFSLTIASLYVGFTPVGKNDVEGLQTRYLVPILLMIMIPIACINVDNQVRNYERKVGFMMGVGLINMLAGILIKIF